MLSCTSKQLVGGDLTRRVKNVKFSYWTNRSVVLFPPLPYLSTSTTLLFFHSPKTEQQSVFDYIQASGMAETKDEVKPRDSFSFWNEKAKQPHSPPSPRENDLGPKSMPSGQITDRVKLIEQALAKPKFGLGPASSPPPAPSKDKKDKNKANKDDEEDKEPVRKGSRTPQTPTIGKRDLTSSAGPSPTGAKNGVPIIPSIVSSPMFDRKIKSAAQSNKTLTSPHRLQDDENDFGKHKFEYYIPNISYIRHLQP